MAKKNNIRRGILRWLNLYVTDQRMLWAVWTIYPWELWCGDNDVNWTRNLQPYLIEMAIIVSKFILLKSRGFFGIWSVNSIALLYSKIRFDI